MSGDLPKPTDLFLVAYMPNPRDMEIARLFGWYRIPLRTAPKVVAVDYLAFYQPTSFGNQKWRIEYYARVRGHELVTRADLLREEADHPKAREEYFKIQLGTLVHLSKPILADKWKRITFFYTTGEYFLRAGIISDLVVHSDERKLLWRALREKADRSQIYGSPKLPEMDVDPEILATLLGIREMASDYEG
jgi:hypothetical protein